MIDHFDPVMVDWARAQFALTAMYHWIFVPLTLGLSFLCAFFETIYVRTGNEEWKRLTRFWMKLFGINFAIGVATGIILEFEFGTNWSNYSWMVGDIFGAPLAIEGIVAFFLEATFFAVMFFGWDRVSKRFHLLSTWMVAIGSNLSALWILVANAWMQHPTGMKFNPDAARFEMQNVMDVILSPVAISKFTHTTSSSFLLASLFVISVSCWYLLKKRHILLAKRSITVAATFGLIAAIFTAATGDEAAFAVAKHQPMKLAAFEGLWHGEKGAGIVAAGIPNPDKKPGDSQEAFSFEVRIPGLLSILAKRSASAYVPGINDLVFGNPEHGIVGAEQRIELGKKAITALAEYKKAQKDKDTAGMETALATFDQYRDHLGYGYLTDPAEAVPPVAISFYSFHIMVILGTFFIFLCIAFLAGALKGKLENLTVLQLAGVTAFFLALIASQAGWVVAEVGRQPWTIQDLLPVSVARSNLTADTVKTTFFMFLGLFTLLLLAEIRIMTTQIGKGPEED